MTDVAEDGAAPRSQIERKEKTAGSRAARDAGLVFSTGATGRGRGADGGGGTGTVEDWRYRSPAFCTYTHTYIHRREQLSRKSLKTSLTALILSFCGCPFTHSSGSYNYNSIKICKQISTPPQPC